MRSVLTTRFYLKRTDELNVFTSQVTLRFFLRFQKSHKTHSFMDTQQLEVIIFSPKMGFLQSVRTKYAEPTFN